MQAVEDQTYNGWKNYPTWAVTLGYALDSVDWYEIADAWLED